MTNKHFDFGRRYAGRRVLVTGHTGFKGGWLSLWLQQLGAEVHGIALPPATEPSLFATAQVEGAVNSRTLDIRNAEAVRQAVQEIRPEIVFHLAAQPLVRLSYRAPLETFDTNVMGTANLLDACCDQDELKGILCITTDKVYANQEWAWPYRETDAIGGKDPYSASKAAMEHIVASYRHSYFKAPSIPLLTARGGNVIGGGDWSEDRLVPDLMRAVLDQTPLTIRNPASIRPWQHVLGLCHGYLLLMACAMAGDTPGDGAWNFGPEATDNVTVASVLERFAESAVAAEIRYVPTDDKPESAILTLDSSKARRELGWRPALDLNDAIDWTASWHAAAARNEDMGQLTISQIAAYTARLESV